MSTLQLDPKTSARLAQIPQKGTKPEMKVRSIVRALGYHYRANHKGLPGSPDLANKSKKWAIFVHGCYWHHHEDCSKATIPKRNKDFWVAKFSRNRERDAQKVQLLKEQGIRVLVIWECELRENDEAIEKVAKFLKQ